MKEIILDLETTGLDPNEDEIIAVGLSDAWCWEPKIFVRRPGEPEMWFLGRIIKHIPADALIVGYNVGFDIDFLRTRYPRFESTRYIDLLYHIVELYGRRMRLKEATKLYFPCVDNGDVDGNKVPELWERGETEPIRRHLEADIYRTWLLANALRPLYLYPSTVATTKRYV